MQASQEKRVSREALRRVGVPFIETAYFPREESAKLCQSYRERMPSRLLAALEHLHHTGAGAEAAVASKHVSAVPSRSRALTKLGACEQSGPQRSVAVPSRQ